MKVRLTNKFEQMLQSASNGFQIVPKAGKIIAIGSMVSIMAVSFAGCGNDKEIETTKETFISQTTISNTLETTTQEQPTTQEQSTTQEQTTTQEETLKYNEILSYPFEKFPLSLPRESIQTFDWTNAINILKLDQNFQSLYRGGIEHLFPHLNLDYALAYYVDLQTGEDYHKIVDRYGYFLNEKQYHKITGINAYTTVVATEDEKSFIFNHITGKLVENIKGDINSYTRINNNYFYSTITNSAGNKTSTIYDVEGNIIGTYNNVICDNNKLYLVSDASTEVVDLTTNQAQQLGIIVDKVQNGNIIYHNSTEELYGLCTFDAIGTVPEEKITPQYLSLDFFGEESTTLIATGINQETDEPCYAIISENQDVFYITDSKINKIESKSAVTPLNDNLKRPKLNYAYITYNDQNIIISQNGSLIFETSSTDSLEFTVGNVLVYNSSSSDQTKTLKTAIDMETGKSLVTDQENIVFIGSLGSRSGNLMCISENNTCQIPVQISTQYPENGIKKVK